jgi:hypothetical protein
MIRILAAALLVMITTGCTVFGLRGGTEEPPFQTVASLEGGIEIRRYAPRLYVEARVPADQEDARNTAFRKLFRYIGGANGPAEEIAMTIPVETDAPSSDGSTEIAMTAPVESTRADGMMAMRFFLPKRFTLATAPRPSDPAVSLGTLPEQRMAVLVFSGSSAESRVAARKADLVTAIEANPDWTLTTAPVAYFYDPPWTLPMFKRNEVAAPVAAVE